MQRYSPLFIFLEVTACHVSKHRYVRHIMGEEMLVLIPTLSIEENFIPTYSARAFVI